MPQTGPRTPQGKARSSRNAARHGLYSRALVAGDETLDEWHHFRDGVVAALCPRRPAEADLARRIAVLIWLLRRVARAESAIASRDPAALTTTDGGSLDVIARREATLSRQLHRAFRHLDALRAARDPLSLLDRLRETTGK
jgi:hypothetical protein